MEIQGFDKVLILWWKKNQNQNKTLTFQCYPFEMCSRTSFRVSSLSLKTQAFDMILPIFMKFLIKIQVNLCQKHLFLQQLTHNMSKDCSLNYNIMCIFLQKDNMMLHFTLSGSSDITGCQCLLSCSLNYEFST